ncbi:MAG: exosome complex protein Rrp42 [Methanomicrobiales archaeon]
MTEIIPEITKKSITDLINNGERADNRPLDEYREVSLETGVITKAEGSARVKIGNTQLMIGAKSQIAEPFPDTPNKGVLMTNSELLPMASPTFEPGPPDERSVELSRVVDRCIREGGVIDLEKLCIVPGDKVWMIFLDIHVLDYDGNLLDAAALGCLAALLDTSIPTATCEDDEILIDYEKMVDLPINEKALLCTFAKIGNELVLDPSLEEEQVMGARISVGVIEDGSVCAMQKGGEEPLSKEEILKAINITREKTNDLRKYLK